MSPSFKFFFFAFFLHFVYNLLHLGTNKQNKQVINKDKQPSDKKTNIQKYRNKKSLWSETKLKKALLKLHIHMHIHIYKERQNNILQKSTDEKKKFKWIQRETKISDITIFVSKSRICTFFPLFRITKSAGYRRQESNLRLHEETED